MSNQRYIDVSFWDDAWIQDLDPSEKLVYMYLLTNPLTNIAGVYQLTRKRICFDTGFTSETIGHILQKFESAKKVYTFNEYIILKNWCKHQKVEGSAPNKVSNVKIGIDRILNELPDDLLIHLKRVGYSYSYLDDLLKNKGLEGACKDLELLNLDLTNTLTNTSTSQTFENQQKTIDELAKNLEEANKRISEQSSLISKLANKASSAKAEGKSSSRSRTSSRPKCSNEDYEAIKNAFEKAADSLRGRYSIPEKIISNYGAFRVLVAKKLNEGYSVQDIIAGINQATKDEWCVKTKNFTPNAVFGPNKLGELISASTIKQTSHIEIKKGQTAFNDDVKREYRLSDEGGF